MAAALDRLGGGSSWKVAQFQGQCPARRPAAGPALGKEDKVRQACQDVVALGSC